MGSAETERPLGEVFDSVAEDYDLVRQGYPAVLVDAAIVRGGLTNGARVLEVGCGTGKLTELLAVRDLNVDAVDPRPRMIEQAKRRVGGGDSIRFHVGRFEDVAFPEEAFEASSPQSPSTGSIPSSGGRKLLRTCGQAGCLRSLHT